MLEIRNLNKTYKSKTGESVKALDNVSISFPESGMIFILGKSGSGKSTLLNVMGGLDSYDSGEFIIKGKSSNDFGNSDFDAYRNTFIGFIFQEYNVLDDFTVGANIGLALELQGKKATNDKINGILSKVDLLNYAKRKPNELSGGQKQRVAIARALVKDPQIIMADEPTGALDSNTGKQIFDTLKELSKEKLVLIVSHDRDFAEKYADRIIELCDGQIISDVTKHEKQSVQLSEGIQKINDNLLRIKGGYRLTTADLQMINDYLSQNHNDIILSSDGRINDELRSAVGISAEGNTSIFEGTDAKKDYKLKEYKKEDSKFIRSKLPMKNALRIGSSSLKHKKFRLVMTIFLSLIAFALFGFADTLGAYNKVTSAVDSIVNANVTSASMSLGVKYTYTYDDGETHTYYNKDFLNDDDIKNISDSTGLEFSPVFSGNALYGGGGFSLGNQLQQYESNNIFKGTINGMVNMSQQSIEQAGYTVSGELPDEPGEIAITELLYRQFNQYGFKNDSFKEKIDAGKLNANQGDDNSILGKHITLNNISNRDGTYYSYEIVGVIDTKFDYERYNDFMPTDNTEPNIDDGNALKQMVLLSELESEINYGVHALCFLGKGDMDALSTVMSSNYKQIFNGISSWNSSSAHVSIISPTSSEESFESTEKNEVFNGGSIVLKPIFPSTGNNFSSYAGSEAIKELDVTWLDGNSRDKLGEKEIIVHEEVVNNLKPETFTITLDNSKLLQIAYGIVAEEYLNTYSTPENSLEQRIFDSAPYAFIDYMFEKDAENVTIAITKNYKDYNGIAQDDPFTLSEQEAKDYWYQYWNDHEDAPLNYYTEQYYKSQIGSEAQREFRKQQALYYAELLAINLSDDIKQNPHEEIINRLNDVFSNKSEDQSTVTVEIYNISTVLKAIYSYEDATSLKLWENDEFVTLMKENDYVSKWDEMNDENKKNSAINFYMHYFIDNGEYGAYETNKFGGHTMTQINEEAAEFILKAANFSMSEAASELQILFVEENHESGTTTTLHDLSDYVIVGTYANNSGERGIVSDTIYQLALDYEEESREEAGVTFNEEVAEHDSGAWAYAIAPIGDDRDVIQQLVEMSYDEESDLQFSMQNAVMNTLSNFNDFIEIFAVVALWVGVGFAVFSALLLMNFISTSISYKKREIGVLRAVGARSSDVFKIFFSEAAIIALINFILATATTIAAVIFTNSYMNSQGINITLLHFGVRQFLLMIAVSLAVAFIASFLPVYNIARRKPIDAIRDK